MKSESRTRWLVATLGIAVASISAVRADFRETGIHAAARQVPSRVETADRFDWADAAVGAGVATGLLVTASAALGRKSPDPSGEPTDSPNSRRGAP